MSKTIRDLEQEARLLRDFHGAFYNACEEGVSTEQAIAIVDVIKILNPIKDKKSS